MRLCAVVAKMEALRTLVAERLTEAAEEITERLLHTPEISPEQQRAVIRKRLLVVADEIFRILEITIGGCETEASCCLRENEHQCKELNINFENETHLHQTDKLPLFGSSCEKNISFKHQKYDQRRSLSPLLKGPDPPQIKDLRTETDSEFISSKPSQFHQTQQPEEGTSTMMETEKEGERSGVPSTDLKVLSSKNPKAGSESKDVNEKQLKSNKRTFRTGSQGTNVFKSGRSYHKRAAGKKMKNHLQRTATTNKSKNTGHSCCRVCGKFFQYRRSFLKHALVHEKSADVCGVCGKHLDSETLKVHLKTHSKEKNQQAGNRQAEVECSESESDGDWKKSEGSDSNNGDGDKEESEEGACLQTSKTKTERSNEHHLETEEISRLHLGQTEGHSCCRVCGKFFRYKRSFLKHVFMHEQRADVCGVCGKHLDSDECLRVHLKTHSEENSCRDQTDDKQSEAECADAESREGESDEDWKKSEGSDSEESDKEDSKQKSKRKHKGHKNRDLCHLKYCCKVCGKFFCYRASFLRHVQEDEKDADLCGMCGKHFETKESLKLHLQTYIRTHDCEVCGKHFESHKQLEMHMRTHTGEKPFVCTVCGKAFAQNGNLMGHMRAHTGERPYVCSVCGQSFSFKEYMRAHMRIHTGEKPFLCSVCGKGFRQRGTLKTHMMIHTGESTHQCVICDKKFYKSGALKIHMRSHTGEKPYLCNVCGKSFTAGGSLTKHMGVHEGERTHHCSTCGKTFLRKDELKRHVDTHRDESIQLMSL